jgi:hypothetical protein
MLQTARQPRCFPGWLWRGNDGREKNLPNSEHRESYPERSPNVCSPSSPVDQVGQAFRCTSPFTHGTSIRKRQCSLWSIMVRLWSVISTIHRLQSRPGSNHSSPDRSHGNPMERAKQVRSHPQGRWWKVLGGLPILSAQSTLSIDVGVMAPRFSKERTSSATKPA